MATPEKIVVTKADVGELAIEKPAPTKKDRLHALVAKIHPPFEGFEERGHCCEGVHDPVYRIEEPKPGLRRIRITDPATGDTISGTGATLDEALTALEAKLK